jgi:hypothetical protein
MYHDLLILLINSDQKIYPNTFHLREEYAYELTKFSRKMLCNFFLL